MSVPLADCHIWRCGKLAIGAGPNSAIQANSAKLLRRHCERHSLLPLKMFNHFLLNRNCVAVLCRPRFGINATINTAWTHNLSRQLSSFVWKTNCPARKFTIAIAAIIIIVAIFVWHANLIHHCCVTLSVNLFIWVKKTGCTGKKVVPVFVGI